jgi:hypothetical protein
VTLEELYEYDGPLTFRFVDRQWVVICFAPGDIIEGRGRTITEAARELEVAAIKHSLKEKGL